MNLPSEIAANYITIAKSKTENKLYKLLVLAVLAGVFISIAAVTATTAGSGLSGMQATLVKAAVFPVGLVLVVVCGAELFTGNSLLIAPAIERKITVRGMLKNWGIVYIGNLAGCVLIAALVAVYNSAGGAITEATVAIAAAKCNMSFGEMFVRGILCNMLVCLAVWATMASKNIGGKVLALYLPIFAFVVCGFEHSVANMYYLNAGLITQALSGVTAEGLTLGNAIISCLIPSTIGNVIGGSLIAVAYWAAYRTKLPPAEQNG